MRLSPLLLATALAADAPKEWEPKDQFREFGWDLLFNSGTSSENKVISPVSIMGAMYMLAAGSTGDSQQEIIDALTGQEGITPKSAFTEYFNLRKFLTHESNKYQLNIANGVFAREGLLVEGFEDAVGEFLRNDKKNFATVDFTDADAATQQINEWISKQTNGQIDEMYQEPLDEQTALILASSLYFKSSWQKAFTLLDPANPDDEELANSACWPVEFGDTSQCNEGVEWIYRTDNFYYRSIQENGLEMEVLELPFTQGKNIDIKVKGEDSEYTNRLFFRIWFPKEHDIRDPEFDEQYQDLIKKKSQNIRDKMNQGQRVRLVMPKFSINFDQDIKTLMEQVNIQTIFGEDKDFSPMVGDRTDDVEISKINHKVKFDLDERGVEGSAVTAVEISFRTISTPKPITITRPFYFSIVSRCWDQSSRRNQHKGCPFGNVPLFTGKVTDPSLK